MTNRSFCAAAALVTIASFLGFAGMIRTNRNTVTSNPFSGKYSTLSKESNILPEPMVLLKRGVSLRQAYNVSAATTAAVTGRRCSCSSPAPPNSSQEGCCFRKIQAAHKMGVYMIWELKNETGMPRKFLLRPGEVSDTQNVTELLQKRDRDEDFRLVLMTRNIYEALVSGYLYHLSGESLESIRIRT